MLCLVQSGPRSLLELWAHNADNLRFSWLSESITCEYHWSFFCTVSGEALHSQAIVNVPQLWLIISNGTKCSHVRASKANVQSQCSILSIVWSLVMSRSIRDYFHVKDGLPDPRGIALGLTRTQAQSIITCNYTGEVWPMKYLSCLR